uniref:Amino acid permease/ SLC12A domain-containing protein n=1 Tax=Strigamia maritima TaxID=126957 RepID=T1IJ06_STRMM
MTNVPETPIPEKEPLQESQTEVKLKRELGLLDGVAIIVGVIIGSGIFVSPKGVLKEAGSIGLALVVWILCGVLSMIGALCYAGTVIASLARNKTEVNIPYFLFYRIRYEYTQKVWEVLNFNGCILNLFLFLSGGDYAYIQKAFGPLPAFLYLWVALVVINPTGNAITALTFANYILQPIYPSCDPPTEVVRLVAAGVICLLTFVNCYDVKWATKVQDIFTFTKVMSLIIIIISGFAALGLGKTNSENFDNIFEGTETQPSYIALSFYSGLFSYSGWNYLNFVTEELKDPYKSLPRAIMISIPLVTLVYVLTNVAYFIVLSPYDLLASNAVAVTFGERMLGVMSWIMPFFVACSTFGGLNGGIFTASRLFFVGARQGHLPDALAMININKFTPMPSLVFLGLVTLVMLSTSDVYELINYTSFVESVFITCSVAGLLWLRWKEPKLVRPIKVNLIFPIIFLIICLFLICTPIVASPRAVGLGILITLSGIPIYLLGVYWESKPEFVTNAISKFDVLV